MARTQNFGLLLSSVVLSLVPTAAHAAGGARSLATFIADNIIVEAMLAFWGISAAFVTFYAFRMILESQNEQAYGTAQKSFMYSFFGFVTIALGVAFAEAFFTSGFAGNQTTINPSAIIPGLTSVSSFIFTASAGFFVLIVVIAGFRMITTQGEQGEFDKWRKVLVGNAIGVVIMVLSSILVSAIAGKDAISIGTELAGLAMFVLTVFGFACAFALIVAGILLIVSVDEGLKDRAKKIVFGTLITLAIVLSLVALINTFVFSAS
ncbi:MAG: hypothetical protein ABL890_05045 [Candidatus Peribacteraceae bacterium]